MLKIKADVNIEKTNCSVWPPPNSVKIFIIESVTPVIAKRISNQNILWNDLVSVIKKKAITTMIIPK